MTFKRPFEIYRVHNLEPGILISIAALPGGRRFQSLYLSLKQTSKPGEAKTAF